MTIDTLSFYEKLKNSGYDFFTGVPDSLLKDLCSCILDKTPDTHNIICANEGNAVAICAGYHLSTGKVGVAYMQNSGEGNAINPLLSLVDSAVYSIPILLIIGWRGEPGVHDEPQHIKQGKVTIDLLDVIGIEYTILDDIDNCIHKANKVTSKNRPFALIVKKGTFSKYDAIVNYTNFPMKREEALQIVLDSLDNDDFTVSTTGKTSREIFEIRESRKQSHSNDFLTVGSMGHTSSIAFGMALGTKKNVYCIDGDGSFIMHMGGNAVIGSKLPSNYRYILNDNRSHESVGGQPTCTGSLDLKKILEGFGFKKVIVVTTNNELKDAMNILKTNEKSALIIRTSLGSRSNLGRPTTTPVENKQSIMKKLRD